MKHLLGLIVAPGLLAGSLVAFSAPAADATGPCTVLSTTGDAATVTCSGPGQFRAYVHCRRTTSSTYAYYSFGPWRASGGKSTASCSQQAADYRDGQGADFPG